MYKKGFGLLLALACSLSTAIAQEGHPLVGTWQGDWITASGEDNFLTVIMYWDGENITGIVNPGPDSTELASAQLDSSTWTVHIETELKDAAGATVHFAADGKLENVGSYNRTLTGEWQHENGSGNFTLTRQGGA